MFIRNRIQRTHGRFSAIKHVLTGTVTTLSALCAITSHAATCEYIVENEWSSGFVASIRITNDDTSALNGWDVCWTYDGSYSITSSWNHVTSGSNPYCATPLSWNSVIQPGESIEFGFQGSGSSPAPIPEVQGDICGGDIAEPINTAPIAQFTYSINDRDLTVNASNSSDADGDTLTYNWSFGDNTTDTGINTTHTYDSDGIYIVTLTVSDGEDNHAITQTIAIETLITPPTPSPVNSAPIAAFSYTTNELSVAVNAASSSDIDGDALTYTWSFGDGETNTGVQSSHSYATDGEYTVSLTVNDGLISDDISQNISVITSSNTTPNDCSIDYAIANSNSTSFQVNVTVTNNSATTYSGYDMSWDLGPSESFGSGWNAEFTSSGGTVVASNTADHWNGTLTPNGGSISFGVIINKASGADPFIPSAFNGICDSASNGGDNGGTPPEPEPDYACGIDPNTIPSDDDWLTTDGNQIVDSSGNSVWLTGANWFGMNATERVFHGLWSVNMENLVRETAERGINLIRVPISTELLKEWQNGVFDTVSVNLSTNPKLTGLNSLEIFDHFLDQAKSCGVKVLMDVHSAEADNSGHVEPMWYKGDFTTADWIGTQQWLANRYKDNDTIIGYDLENEPHGVPSGTAESTQGADESDYDYCNRLEETTDTSFAKWDDSTDINNWKYAAEQAASAILEVHPNALILVEGVESYATHGKWVNPSKIPNQPDPCYDFNWWGGNLKGVADMEVEVPGHQDQIMYSPHEYGPLVFLQSWFQTDFDRDSLRADVWEPNWLYIHNNNISPLLIGEWGGFMDGGNNQKWMEALRDEIADLKLHHTFWVINPNSGDTGGLLESDWVTWDEDKYNLLKPALWQSGDKFIGLDKVVPIGGTADTGTTRP